VQFAGQRRPPRRPLKQPLGRHRPRRVRSWRGLPSSREPAAIAPMVANQASSMATSPGMDAPGPVTFSRPRAETCATSKPTLSARNTDCLLAGTAMPSGGIAPACSPESIRSPNSGDRDVSARRYRPAGSLSRLMVGSTSGPTLAAGVGLTLSLQRADDGVDHAARKEVDDVLNGHRKSPSACPVRANIGHQGYLHSSNALELSGSVDRQVSLNCILRRVHHCHWAGHPGSGSAARAGSL